MASAPVTPTPPTPVATIPSTPGFIAHWITFIKAHEKLLIIALAGFLVFHFYSKAIDAWVNHDKLAAQTAANQVKADDSVVLSLKAQLATLQTQLDATNAAIRAKNVAVQAATKVLQQTDATLTPSDLSARLAKLLNVSATEITPAPLPNKIQFDNDAAIKTAQALETVPALQSEVDGLNTIIANQNTIITKQADLITQLNKDITDEKTSHTKDVNELKAQNKKSWLNGFKWGIVAGFTLGIVSHNAGV